MTNKVRQKQRATSEAEPGGEVKSVARRVRRQSDV